MYIPKRHKLSFFGLFVLYILFFGASAFHGIFLPVYLDYLKFNKSTIGIILSMSYLITIVSQPLWGIICDRAKFKNHILIILLFSSAIIFILIPLYSTFWYLLIAISLFAFFERSIRPISDTIALECIENTKWKFNHVIFAGTIGYAIISIFAGKIIAGNMNNLFIFYFLFNICALIVSFIIPKVEGHQRKNNKKIFFNIFHNKELTSLLLFSLLIHMINGYLNSFFSIYFKQTGADYTLLGIATCIATLSELIFLFLADKILYKVGIKVTLICSAIITGIRCITLHFLSNMYLILMSQLMHGFTFVVLIISLSTYINKSVPKEFKAFGQTLNILIGIGIAPMIGTFVGGKLSDIIGIKQVLLFGFLFVALTVIIFIPLLFFNNLKNLQRIFSGDLK